jgi:gamma-butyrobetaine dioxygenase/trimethyllysine dioxygenase
MSQVSITPTRVGPFEITSVEVDDGWLRVHFASRAHADFHLRWLRHNGGDDRHPLTRERTRCSSELSDGLAAHDVRVADGDLLVSWSADEAPIRYEGPWLAQNAYAWNREAPAAPSSDLVPVTIDARAHRSWSDVARSAYAAVQRDGIAIVRGRLDDRDGPPEDDTEPVIAAFGEVGLVTTATHFGRIEDLRTDNTTNANNDQLGYTDAPIELHTDQAFLEEPPRYQLLQAIRPATRGGENSFVDALAAARHLGNLDQPALELLLATPVRFHRQQRSFEKVLDAPILELGRERFRVRLSYFTLAPLRLPFAKIDAFYRAHDRFVRLIREPRHRRRVALGAGEWVLYDNHRTLHARTGFEGPRWVRGVYFDEVAR